MKRDGDFSARTSARRVFGRNQAVDKSRSAKRKPRRLQTIACTAVLLSLAAANVVAGPGAGNVASAAVGPVGSGFTVTPSDLAYILKQIKIAERHSRSIAGTEPTQAANPNVANDPEYCASLLPGPLTHPADAGRVPGPGAGLSHGVRPADRRWRLQQPRAGSAAQPRWVTGDQPQRGDADTDLEVPDGTRRSAVPSSVHSGLPRCRADHGRVAGRASRTDELQAEVGKCHRLRSLGRSAT